MGDQAWVTLATNDSYALGALVLCRSLKRSNTTRKIVCMITPGVSGAMGSALSSEFDQIMQVNVLDSQDSANLALLTRPELGITFTKLHCWRLTEFSKCVFLDADTMVLQHCDELFDRDELSAAPDVGWPDCFNSGVFVFKPSIETYDKLLQFAIQRGSFDGGDQGLLNLYFNDWSVSDISKHLPFIYNMVASATYSYLPAYKVFGANVKIVHFIGPEKPWLMYFDSSTGMVRPPMGQEHLQELLQSWWNIFRADVHTKLSPDMSGLAGAFAKMSLEGVKTSEQIEIEEQMRKHAWESGHIDYLGRDSFDNIMKKIQASMAQTAPPKSPSPPKEEPMQVQVAAPEVPQAPEPTPVPSEPPKAPELTPAQSEAPKPTEPTPVTSEPPKAPEPTPAAPEDMNPTEPIPVPSEAPQPPEPPKPVEAPQPTPDAPKAPEPTPSTEAAAAAAAAPAPQEQRQDPEDPNAPPVAPPRRKSNGK